MKVEILSRKLIKPATPTPPHLRSLKASSIDQLQPPIHGAFILYYHANGDENGERSKRLEQSLSEILTLFYPIVGRYIKDMQMFDCNDEGRGGPGQGRGPALDEGVEYMEAKVSGQLAQLVKGEVEVEVLNHLVPYAMPLTSTTPLAFVQVNMFECGGLAIAWLISHYIVDGIAACTFLNAWTNACRASGINNEVVRPRFDLASFFPPRENIPAVKPKIHGAIIITRRFVFNGAAISSLKAIACDSALTKRQLSRVVVVTACMWKALIAVAKVRHGHLRASILFHSLSLHGKTALPIPNNSFGNLYMVANARFGGDSENKMELHELVASLDNSIRNTLADCRKQQNGDDLASMMFNSFREPIWVSGTPKPVEMVCLNDTKDGDGIEAWVSLDEKDMLLFQNHPEVKAFTSQI
uniref:Uncharacterized protein n=1 Tax=Fagus sylvatica TaxID=28930 RepID=A0A2N9HNM7_FAGSY